MTNEEKLFRIEAGLDDDLFTSVCEYGDETRWLCAQLREAWAANADAHRDGMRAAAKMVCEWCREEHPLEVLDGDWYHPEQADCDAARIHDVLRGEP